MPFGTPILLYAQSHIGIVGVINRLKFWLFLNLIIIEIMLGGLLFIRLLIQWRFQLSFFLRLSDASLISSGAIILTVFARTMLELRILWGIVNCWCSNL